MSAMAVGGWVGGNVISPFNEAALAYRLITRAEDLDTLGLALE